MTSDPMTAGKPFDSTPSNQPDGGGAKLSCRVHNGFGRCRLQSGHLGEHEFEAKAPPEGDHNG